VIVECPKCHAENKDDSKHCGNCAAPLGPGAASLIDLSHLFSRRKCGLK
jgi:hypothetical protein